MTAWIEAGFEQGHTPQISVLDLYSRLHSERSARVLDVRSPKEWADAHIEGTLHIPGGELPARVEEVQRDPDLYVICGTGYRSSVATSVLERAGHCRVTNVVGGMSAWINQKLPIVSGDQPRRATSG